MSELRYDNPITVLIHGNCVGPDQWAELVIGENYQGWFDDGGGPQLLRFTPDWSRHGNRAGFVRNEQMLVVGKPDLVLAFWDGKSHGTLDMIRRAVAGGVPVRIISLEEPAA